MKSNDNFNANSNTLLTLKWFNVQNYSSNENKNIKLSIIGSVLLETHPSYRFNDQAHKQETVA